MSAKLKYRLRQLQNSRNHAIPLAAPAEPVSRTPQPANQLPKIKLMKLDGELSLWTPLSEQFKQPTHNNRALTDVNRFACLRSVLTGDAASAIAGLPATASCYCEALDILKQRFAKTDVIIQAHTQRLIDMRPVQSSNDLRELRCLYGTVRTQSRGLKTLRVSEDSYSAMFYPFLLKSLPHDIVLDFNKAIARQRTERPGWPNQELRASIVCLLFFIKREVESRERTVVLHVSAKEHMSKCQDTRLRTSTTASSRR
ncbi:hypothetical protein HPB51_011880 [Rhipicephalus microplus]|uniref:Tick transposon n=1 Tax=Rhipicephalus microplus TaxID=6941 RepID=A0A9J6E972_RHIMP|nr:hypothetical protein HPB51_011880 [Rhipicephalus microplus]